MTPTFDHIQAAIAAEKARGAAALQQISEDLAATVAALGQPAGTWPTLKPTSALVSGPVDIPDGVLPRGGALDYYAAPVTAPYFLKADGTAFPEHRNASRGTAPLTGIGGDVVAIDLDVADKVTAGGGATGTWQQWLYLDTPVTDLTFSMARQIDDTDLGRTGKAGGFGSFDGNWAEWPGGGTYGDPNCMLRSTHWWWDRAVGTKRLANLLKTGGADAAAILDDTGATPRRYIASAGHSLETYLDALGEPPAGPAADWIETRYVAHWSSDFTGWLETWVRYINAATLVAGAWSMPQRLENIRWVADPAVGGFNLVYLSFMYGGTALDYAPADGAGRVSLRDLWVAAGLHRPV
jgi:hypothetical protein